MNILKTMSLAPVMAALLCGTAMAQDKTELTVLVYGGSFETGWIKSVIEPFEAANPDIDVKIANGLTMQSVALMRAQKDAPEVDVIMMDEIGAAQAKAEGLFEPLTLEAVPNLAKLHPQFRVEGDTYTKFMYVTQVLAYNKDYVTETPTSWDALWDAKYEGSVVLPDITTSHGAFLLLTANDMTGGTVQNVDSGFEKLKELKPNVLTFYTQHAQMAQLFEQGDAAMTSWTSDRAQGAIDAGANLGWVIPKESVYLIDSTIGISKGTKKLDAANRYIDYVLSTEAQTANAANTYLSPTNAEVVLSPEVAAKLPQGEGVLESLKVIDWDYVNTVRSEWTNRWNRDVASK